jgi:hypothetical protein
VDQSVPVERLAKPFGGARVRYLYGSQPRFLCRTCSKLRHASAREGEQDRACRKVRKLRRRIGADPDFEAVIPRPAGMHWKTWEKAVDEIIAAEAAAMEPIMRHFLKFETRAQPKPSLRPACGSFWSLAGMWPNRRRSTLRRTICAWRS